MTSSVDCEIYQVPLEEEDNSQDDKLQVLPPLKPKTKRVLSEKQKQQCRENLAKAVQKKKELASLRKAKLEEELKSIKKKSKSSITKKSKPKPKPVSESEESEEEEYYSEEESEPEPPKVKSKAKLKVKTEKDKRLESLEQKLNEIMENTQKLTVSKAKARPPSIKIVKETPVMAPPNPSVKFLSFF